jgi:hypothetical protein
MAQRSWCGYLVNPSGHRLVVQVGDFKFPKQTAKVTMAIKFRRLYAAHITPKQKAAGGGKTACIGAYLPYVSATQFSVAGPNVHKLVVSRKSGATMSGLTFSYTLIGC